MIGIMRKFEHYHVTMTLTVEYHKFLPTTVRENFLLYYKIISKAYYKDFYSINFYFINGMTSH